MNVQTLIRLADLAQHEPVYSDPRFPPSLYYRFMKLLAAEMKPRLSVELGVCGGGGSLHLALGWPQGDVIGVDIRVEYPDNLTHLVETLPNFMFLEADSIEAAEEVYMPIDILFIDTVHTYEQTKAELQAYTPMMKPGSVVLLDDLFRDGMINVWNEIPEGQKVRLDHLHISGSPTDGGFGAIII